MAAAAWRAMGEVRAAHARAGPGGHSASRRRRFGFLPALEQGNPDRPAGDDHSGASVLRDATAGLVIDVFCRCACPPRACAASTSRRDRRGRCTAGNAAVLATCPAPAGRPAEPIHRALGPCQPVETPARHPPRGRPSLAPPPANSACDQQLRAPPAQPRASIESRGTLRPHARTVGAATAARPRRNQAIQRLTSAPRLVHRFIPRLRRPPPAQHACAINSAPAADRAAHCVPPSVAGQHDST